MASAGVAQIEALLEHRVVFVAGKGGSGKTTMTAALALRAAHMGKRVLAIEVDAKGDLSRALGSTYVGYKPQLVQHNISVLALTPEESMREYLHVFFKVPRAVRITPMSKVFDFIATGIPGPKEMVVVGKIAYEERATGPDDEPEWDLILVDAMSSGQVVSHLAAAREGLKFMQGGLLARQLEWVDEIIRDRDKTTVALTSIPEEMSVVEACELAQKIKRKAGVHISLCFADRVVSSHDYGVIRDINNSDRRKEIFTRLSGSTQGLIRALEMIAEVGTAQNAVLDDLERRLSTLAVPVLRIPLVAGKAGLATTRLVEASLGAEA